MITPLQVHGEQQAHESQVMISVQMAYKDTADLMKAYAVTDQLHLGAFSAVNKIILIFCDQQLRGLVPVMSRRSGVGT